MGINDKIKNNDVKNILGIIVRELQEIELKYKDFDKHVENWTNKWEAWENKDKDKDKDKKYDNMQNDISDLTNRVRKLEDEKNNK